ncbi:MAG TPA: hypothetical protein VFT99_14755, partial [Roseiflexaceae bacterium]|nr:hypothetical protein [Roseiflexaceae bacterium]
LQHADRSPGDVVALVAGLAGLNSPENQEWAERCTAVPGLTCPRLHLNDAEVAHAGAFRSRPGVIAVSGTGSTIFALTDNGRRITNDAFHHYAGAARHLAFDTMHRLLAGDAVKNDQAFVADVLAHWQMPDLAALRVHVADMGQRDYNAEKRMYGAMARLITNAAQSGAPLARAACDQLAWALAIGVRLLGEMYSGPGVDVALIGGVARSRYIIGRVTLLLAKKSEKHYRVIDPALKPEEGATLLALEQAGVAITDEIVRQLARGAHHITGA